jgi:hypothetical protein
LAAGPVVSDWMRLDSSPTDTSQQKDEDVTSQEKVKGPASYFPSIEKKYGKPIDHWMKILANAGPLKHMELVSHLKTEHEMGHGHANALVAWFMSKK